MRHWHKYVDANLSRCNTAAITQHVTRGDFSRWIGDIVVEKNSDVFAIVECPPLTAV